MRTGHEPGPEPGEARAEHRELLAVDVHLALDQAVIEQAQGNEVPVPQVEAVPIEVVYAKRVLPQTAGG